MIKWNGPGQTRTFGHSTCNIYDKDPGGRKESSAFLWLSSMETHMAGLATKNSREGKRRVRTLVRYNNWAGAETIK